MLKNIWGWLRLRFGRGSKRAPIPNLVEWDQIPYSFQIDWYLKVPGLDCSAVRADLKVTVPSGADRREVVGQFRKFAEELEQSSYRLQQAMRLAELDL